MRLCVSVVCACLCALALFVPSTVCVSPVLSTDSWDSREDFEILQVEPIEVHSTRAFRGIGNGNTNLLAPTWDSQYRAPLFGDVHGEREMMTPSFHTGNFMGDEDADLLSTRQDFEILQGVEDEELDMGMQGELKWGQEMKNKNLDYLLGGQYESNLVNSPFLMGSGSGFGSSYGSGYGSFASSKKNRLPVVHLQGAPLLAPSLETKPVTSYVIREQPIKAPRTILQPIIHQRLVEQPITKTRIITQPVIRRLVTQPIIQPHVIQTTNIRNRIIDQPITVPRVTRQDIVRQVLVEQPMTNAPITRTPVFEKRQPRVSTVFMGKQAPRVLSQQEAQLAAHPEFKAKFEEENSGNLKFMNQW